MKKLILFGIVLLLFSSFVSAITNDMTGCSTDLAEYEDYNNSGWTNTNGLYSIRFNEDKDASTPNPVTMFLENVRYTSLNSASVTNTNKINTLSFDNYEFITGNILAWNNAAKTNTTHEFVINKDYNITATYDIAGDQWNLTVDGDSSNVVNWGLRFETRDWGGIYSEGVGTVSTTGFYRWNNTDCPSGLLLSSSINLSSPLPADNSQFNTQLLNSNLTANSSSAFSCNLYINNTFNQTRTGFGAGTNIGVDFNISFGATEQNTYDFIIGCTNTDNDTNTSSHTFYIDNVDPAVDQEDINNSHQESTLTYSINVSDVFLYSFDLSDTCGNSYNNSSISSPFYFSTSYNIETCAVGEQSTNITVCDGYSSSLNCITANYSWNKTAVVNITAYDTINGVFIDSFTINDSSKNISTTNGNVSFWQYAIGNYSLTLDAAGFAVTSATVSFNASINTYQFNLYTTNSFNFTFRSEINEEIINQDITVEFISDVASYNYTAENGTLYADVITPAVYTIRYYSSTPSDYGLIREYVYRLTNRTYQDLTLWMIDDSNSTEITITVYDETTLNLVENAIVHVQRYFIGGNVYRTVAMYSTDVAGKSYFDVEADNQYYKILIDYPWETRKYASEKFYFSATAYNVYISFLEEIAEDFFDEEGIQINIVYSNPTSKFTATWIDSEVVATKYCLYLKKYGQYSKEILNYSCSTAHSGSIELTGFGNDTINYAIFTATINGKEKVIASSWKELVSSKLSAGAFGVFMTAVLVGMFSFMVSFHTISLILGAAALIFARMIGILDLGWPYIFGIFFAALILSLLMRVWKR